MNKKQTILVLISIIVVTQFIPVVLADLSASTSKSEYNHGDTVTISVHGTQPYRRVRYRLYSPDALVWAWETQVDGYGSVAKSISIPTEWRLGVYTLIIDEPLSGDRDTPQFSIVEVEDDTPPPTIPPEDVPDADDIGDDPAGSADDLADADPTDAADVLEEVDTDDAAIVLENMDADDAAEILDEMDSDTAADIIGEMDTETAGDVISEVDSTVAADIIDSLDVEDAGAVMDNVGAEQAADIVEEMTNDVAAAIVEEMVAENAGDVMDNLEVEDAAGIVEFMAVESAGAVMDNVEVDQAAEILTTIEEIETVANVVEEMESENAGEVFEVLEVVDAVEIVEVMDAESSGPVMDNVETEHAAEILTTVEEIATVADIVEEMEPENAGDVFEVIEAEEASEIVVEMEPAAAGPVMDTVDPDDAADIFAEMEVDAAAEVIDNMETESFAEVIEEITVEEEDHFAEIMNDVDEEKAGEVLLEVETSKSADVVRKMAGKNINAAAKRVEAAVKKQLGPDVDPEVLAEKIGSIADSIVNDDVDALVALFNEIANLEDTPSTVATILESMELTNVFTVMTAWVDAGTFTEIAEVYSYFTTDFIETVYLGLSIDERQVVYPYLHAATKAALPEIGEIEVSELTVTPESAERGEDVTIAFVATNEGDEAAVQVLTLRLDSVTKVTEKVTLDAGESITITWTISEETAGIYTVGVNGESASLTIVAPVFQTSNLQVTPATPAPGETVTISVDVENTGDGSGSYTVTLLVDGEETDSETVTVAAGGTEAVSFTVSEEAENTYEVEVDGLTASFTVAEPPGFPWTYVIIGVIVVAVAAYMYIQRREAE